MITSVFENQRDESLPEDGPDCMTISKFVRELHAGRIPSLESERFAAYWAKYWRPADGGCCPHSVAGVDCDRSEKGHPWFDHVGLYRNQLDGKLTLLVQPQQKVSDVALGLFLAYAASLGSDVNWFPLKTVQPGVEARPFYSLTLLVTRE